MYARLWWKDFRQFWPIWLVVLLAAGATQGLILTLAGEAWRHGTLVIAALLFAGLYALAVGAAAFAGEREAGTLPLLDVLAADRRVVWSAKCSFALLSTLILTASLVVMAALGTVEWDLRNPVMALDAAGGVVLVVIALGWALFWSSLLRTALAAALAAMACLWLTLVCLAWDNGLDIARPVLVDRISRAGSVRRDHRDGGRFGPVLHRCDADQRDESSLPVPDRFHQVGLTPAPAGCDSSTRCRGSSRRAPADHRGPPTAGKNGGALGTPLSSSSKPGCCFGKPSRKGGKRGRCWWLSAWAFRRCSRFALTSDSSILSGCGS